MKIDTERLIVRLFREEDADALYRIKMIADRETNYRYHMLSVAKCGYDNDDGAKYRGDYPEEDLAALKKPPGYAVIEAGKPARALSNALNLWVRQSGFVEDNNAGIL